MTTRTTTVEFEGRKYAVDYDPAKANEAMFASVQVYRLRKDGSRGLHVSGNQRTGWSVWELASPTLKA